MTTANFQFLLHLDDPIETPDAMLFEQADDQYFAHFGEFCGGLTSPYSAELHFPTRPAIFLDKERDARSGHELVDLQENAAGNFEALILDSWRFVGEAGQRFTAFTPDQKPFLPDLSCTPDIIRSSYLSFVDGLSRNLADHPKAADDDLRDWLAEKYRILRESAASARRGAFSLRPRTLLSDWPCFDLTENRAPNALYLARLHY